MSLTRRPTFACLTAGLLAAATPLLAQRGPAPEMTHLPADVIAQACAATLAFERPMQSLLITGGQDASTRHVYGPGDLVTINAGSDNGIEVGQEYYVRRVQAPRGTGISRATPAWIRTAGWVRVYAVHKTMSPITVSPTCESADAAAYLSPSTLPH